MVAELAGLMQLVQGADLVVTGEGRFDAQTLRGKTPMGARVAKRAWRAGGGAGRDLWVRVISSCMPMGSMLQVVQFALASGGACEVGGSKAQPNAAGAWAAGALAQTQGQPPMQEIWGCYAATQGRSYKSVTPASRTWQ
ncbi:glycerate kinase [Pseudomonas peli]|uniref:glycerate kinase n=1 Tax=Pseudomonas peli TaxID=592361 RepID=UPI003D15B3E1